ncbi:hypothetical protein L4C37_18130 [Vibrio kagoshimensis]|uniref:hypothetical protein n=1 Tax=Vibrio kagoshimensis TaxID=2910244 RepID=UPI003D1E42D4
MDQHIVTPSKRNYFSLTLIPEVMGLPITPAASEGVIGTRGIVPPAMPRYFFSFLS